MLVKAIHSASNELNANTTLAHFAILRFAMFHFADYLLRQSVISPPPYFAIPPLRRN